MSAAPEGWVVIPGDDWTTSIVRYDPARHKGTVVELDTRYPTQKAAILARIEQLLHEGDLISHELRRLRKKRRVLGWQIPEEKRTT